VLYSNRTIATQFDVVDLDPYGSASVFLDGAVQAVKDGGLLMITCTDLAVLAGGQNTEACFTKYGGLPAKRIAKHEVALRLVLAATARAAARYRRALQPLLSLSIDFYIRVFVRVLDSPLKSKYAASLNSLVYQCGRCETWATQALGTVEEREQVMPLFGSATVTASDTCVTCGGRQRVVGPLWNGPLHHQPFVSSVVQHLRDNETAYGSQKKALSLAYTAEQELDTMLSYQLAAMCQTLRVTMPSMNSFRYFKSVC